VVAERTATGERLVEAVLEVIVTQADGTPLWSGPVTLKPGKRLDWRLLVKPAGVVDGSLISQVILRDRSVLTVEGKEREAREFERQQRAAQAAARAATQAKASAERQAALKYARDREAAIKSRGWPQSIER
jgi:hypothetical protein